MKKMFLAIAGIAMLAAAPAHATDLKLPGLAAIGAIGGGAGIVAGGTVSGSGSLSNVEAFKTGGTVLAEANGYGLAESSIRGDLTTPGYSGVTGAGLSLNVASGSIAKTGATLTDTGRANSSAANLSGAGTVTVGGGFGAGGGLALSK